MDTITLLIIQIYIGEDETVSMPPQRRGMDKFKDGDDLSKVGGGQFRRRDAFSYASGPRTSNLTVILTIVVRVCDAYPKPPLLWLGYPQSPSL